MSRAFFIFVFISVFFPCFSQDNTGFYIEIEKKTNCPQLVRTFDETLTFCVPKRPILDRTVFTSIGDIQVDAAKKRKYIDLHLNSKGMETLKTVVASLPNSNIILVVNDRVVGRLKNKDIVGRFIRIDSDLVSQQIEWIHSHLKANP